MPNRGIKESICTSESLAKLSAEAERLFYRLIVQCDDFGLMFANPNIIKNRCFQFNSEKIKETQMVRWLQELEQAGLVFFYRVDGTNYLKFTKWDKHQQQRAKNPKYPLPMHDTEVLQANDIKCNQMIANVPETSIRDKNTRQEYETSIRDEKTERAPLVLLTHAEFDSFISEYGHDATTWMLNKLSNYKQANGKKYKSDAAAIRSWVVKAWLDDKTHVKTNSDGVPAWVMELPENLRKEAMGEK